MMIIISSIPMKKRVVCVKWKYSTLPLVRNRVAHPPVMGQGLGSTR